MELQKTCPKCGLEMLVVDSDSPTASLESVEFGWEFIASLGCKCGLGARVDWLPTSEQKIKRYTWVKS